MLNYSSYRVMLCNYMLGFRKMLSHRVSDHCMFNAPCMKVIPSLIGHLDSTKTLQSYINCLCPCTGELKKISGETMWKAEKATIRAENNQSDFTQILE